MTLRAVRDEELELYPFMGTPALRGAPVFDAEGAVLGALVSEKDGAWTVARTHTFLADA